MNHALVVLSGGQDSTVCLALALKEFGQKHTHAVTFDYGQRHRAELHAAEVIAEAAGVDHEIVNLGCVLAGSSPLVNREAHVARYSGVDALPGGLEATFVPMRNQLFLTLAANRAAVLGVAGGRVDIFTGVSMEDYGGYPDCRKDFIDSLTRTTRFALEDSSLPFVSFRTPLMRVDKQMTVEMSERLPMARALLAYSHTCYEGEVPPCGSCHACLLRAKGYRLARVTDPLLERLGVPAAPVL